LGGLLAQGAKSIVLDLRNAASGTPEEGIALANLFLEKGAITFLQGQRVAKQSFEADPAKTVYRGPLVVLTNRGTASGAEVAAAALLDHKRAEVVGERSYGDAAQRRAISMEDGSAVILSIAKYYSPLSAKALQDNGVTPSVPVTDTGAASEDEEIEPDAPEQPKKPGEDLILKRAIEVLTKAAVASAASPASASNPAGGEDLSTGSPNAPRPRP
jgi:carboxyl-terminal processing protease